MMPHPERSVLLWQWPHVPPTVDWAESPWIRLFQNAREWCTRDPVDKARKAAAFM